MNSYIVSDIKMSLTIPVYNISTKTTIKNLLKLTTRKKYGFTLAETLITLTIIGVIAAMTIPTLVSKYTNHTYVTGAKKAYAQLQNAIRMMPLSAGYSNGDYSELTYYNRGSSPLGNNNGIKPLTEAWAGEFKTSKVVAKFGNNEKICSVLNNETHTSKTQYNACFQTADGFIISATVGAIVVDVNGVKGPNKIGRDQFDFAVIMQTENGINAGSVIPVGSKLYAQLTDNEANYWRNAKTKNCLSAKTTIKHNWWQTNTCTGQVLDEGKMDY